MKNYKEQVDNLISFLSDNGVQIPEGILIPWEGLLASAYMDGVIDGKDKAYSEIACLCNQKMDKISIIAPKV